MEYIGQIDPHEYPSNLWGKILAGQFSGLSRLREVYSANDKRLVLKSTLKKAWWEMYTVRRCQTCY